MKKILFLFCFLLSGIASAQVLTPENRIVVLGQATVEAPADRVEFSISLSSKDSLSLDKVYEQHKQLENKLIKILRELRIPSKSVQYTLLSVGKRPDYDGSDDKPTWFFEATQEVSFTIDSLSRFQSIQDRLIREGFISFSSHFKSTREEEMKKEVMTKAVNVAKEKAKILAKASNRKIWRIVKVSDTDETDPSFENFSNFKGHFTVAASSGNEEGSLIEIPQNVSFATTIKVVFELR